MQIWPQHCYVKNSFIAERSAQQVADTLQEPGTLRFPDLGDVLLMLRLKIVCIFACVRVIE